MVDSLVVTEDLINDSNYLAYKFNFETECLSFLAINRDEIRQVSSLKQSEIDSNRPFIDVPLAQVAAVLDSADQSLSDNPPRFIFHTAYCGSTFLSRCLDVDGVSISLREPQILLDAANAKRLQWQSQSTRLNYRHLPKLFLALLQKHAEPSEKLIIKPINSVNNIIPELMQLTGSGPALMLYTDARNFVLSTLKKGEGGKQTIRSMFDLLRCDFEHLSNLQLTHTIHMTDLRIIMTLWRLQLEQAEQALLLFAPKSALASLYGEELIINPGKSLQACNRFLKLGISSEQIDAIANSDDRFIDAKNRNERFGVQERKALYKRLESFYGDDLNDGLQWLVRNNAGTQLIPKLSGALR